MDATLSRTKALTAGICSLLLALGVARFAYTPLLPLRPEGAAHEGLSLADCPPSRRFLGLLMAAYFCAGIAYVVSATFIVAVADALPELSGRGNMIFLCIGLGMTVGYGIAQILGPAVTAEIAARSGSYAPGLFFAATSMVLATHLLAVLKVTSSTQERPQLSLDMPLLHGKCASEETAR